MQDGRGWCRQTFNQMDDPHVVKISNDSLCTGHSFSAKIEPQPDSFFYDETTKKMIVSVPVNV